MTTDASNAAVTSCPACQSVAYDTVGRQASAFRCDVNAALTHPAYSVRRCRSCALYYKSHVLPGEQLAAYYAGLDFSPFDGDYGFPTDAALLARLLRLSPGKRILDFGCSTGRILDMLSDAYVRFGVEINETAAAKARSRGITIVTEEGVTAGRAGSFDAIILADVFEHLVEPTATVRMLVEWLAPGGELLIVTGLADTVAPRELLAEYWYFRISGHLQMMSQRHIDWLAREVGLQLSHVEVMSHYRSDAMQSLRQKIQAALYSTVTLSPTSLTAAAVCAVPGLKRAANWTNLPATEQRQDHVLVSLVKILSEPGSR